MSLAQLPGNFLGVRGLGMYPMSLPLLMLVNLLYHDTICSPASS